MDLLTGPEVLMYQALQVKKSYLFSVLWANPLMLMVQLRT